jgi:ABC-2 type transport system ATP-binding protein
LAIQEKTAISVEHLLRRFGETVAVDDILFTVNKGEIFGFLGPNGAGKTTTIKILTTLLTPSSGSASVLEYDVVKDRDKVRNQIGIVFQDPSLDMDLTGRENLRFHGILYKISKVRIRNSSDESPEDIPEEFTKNVPILPQEKYMSNPWVDDDI